MLLSAAQALADGFRIEAAVKFREAIRRHLVALATAYAVDEGGTAGELLDRLQKVGATVDDAAGCLDSLEMVIDLSSEGFAMRCNLEWALNTIGANYRGADSV
ncbi:MAG: hypothetical protein AAFV43_11760 [Planctomycetota bacterium]